MFRRGESYLIDYIANNLKLNWFFIFYVLDLDVLDN
jgi:hypothetical protein